MLRRAPNFAVGNGGSTNAGFTMRTGLAELIYLHPFGPFRFSDMLLSPSGFPSRLAGCPRRCLRSRPPAPGGQSHVRRNGAPQNLVRHLHCQLECWENTSKQPRTTHAESLLRDSTHKTVQLVENNLEWMSLYRNKLVIFAQIIASKSYLMRFSCLFQQPVSFSLSFSLPFNTLRPINIILTKKYKYQIWA